VRPRSLPKDIPNNTATGRNTSPTS
jgi:hypothetical protein